MYWYNPQKRYYANLAMKMYPEQYHKLLPYIKKVCGREDHPYNYKMYPFPEEEKINEMAKEVYSEYNNENSKNNDQLGVDEDLNRGRHHHHHHNNNPLNDIIKILIIKELLDRRDCRRRPWWC